MIKNQYSLELFEKRLNESDSLVEHIMVACDLIEYQINRMINAALGKEKVKELNFSPEQRFSYALAASSALGMPGYNCSVSTYYFWGRLNEVYNLRRMLPNLTPAELEERVKQLYHVGKFNKNDKNWQGIITLINFINDCKDDYEVEAVDLWDPFVMTLYSYLLNFADGFVAHVTGYDESSNVPVRVTAEDFVIDEHSNN